MHMIYENDHNRQTGFFKYFFAYLIGSKVENVHSRNRLNHIFLKSVNNVDSDASTNFRKFSKDIPIRIQSEKFTVSFCNYAKINIDSSCHFE